MATATTSAPPSAQTFTDEQVMLTLALASYRGFSQLTPVVTRRGLIRLGLVEAFETLAPLRDRFDLSWGPATFRAPLTGFDDAAMFAVEDRTVPGRTVVVIRGTNPVSAFDWVFGDFWSQRAVPWRNAASPEAISLSTALGLAVLRLMRSPAATPGWQGWAWRTISERVSDPLRRVLGPPLAASGDAAAMVGSLTPLLRSRLRRLEREMGHLPASPAKRVERAARRWGSGVSRRVIREVDEIVSLAGEDLHLDLLRLLTGTARLRSLLTPGPDLVSFLTSQAAGPTGLAEVVVTGHSKGGALAQALALWLADNQPTWDPTGAARVHCFSYAGPTPGNGAFADRFDRTFGDDGLRVANRLDVVPHAWAIRPSARARGLFVDDVPQLYGPPVRRVGALETLAEVVREHVEPIGYRHTGANVHLLDGEVDPAATLWTAQVSYQHCDQYIVRLGLAGVVDPMWVFGGG